MHPPDNHHHQLFMQRAQDLARLGQGDVSPNPMVGCVIVHKGKIVGEGWHKRYGEAHAEVNAVHAVEDKSVLKDSIVYVNLEPCSHFGKTPPCADMLIREKVNTVVISNLDSNPLVAGEGIKKLKAAGVNVVTGVLESEGRILNKRFFTFIEKQRPYVILKWAQTSDGFIARENFDSKWISDAYSRSLVHQWRAQEDAILVGSQTALHDNPQLNVRDWTGRDPIRIVIDRTLKIPSHFHLFDRTQKTICYNLMKQETDTNLQYVKLDSENFMQILIHDLYQRKVQSVIVEGGAQTLQSFITMGLWDEARVFISPQVFHRGIAAPTIKGTLKEQQTLKNDLLSIYINHVAN